MTNAEALEFSSFPLKKDALNEIREIYEKVKRKHPKKSWNYHIPKTQEARKHDIDISRIIEQALSSITDYM